MENKGKPMSMAQDGACSIFEGHSEDLLISETAKLRSIMTKRGTLEILIPLCCTTSPVRRKQFHQALKGISGRTLASLPKELEKAGTLKRQSFNEIPPCLAYMRTSKGWNLSNPSSIFCNG